MRQGLVGTQKLSDPADVLQDTQQLFPVCSHMLNCIEQQSATQGVPNSGYLHRYQADMDQ